jgi:glycosyltransferase involved in cell wall biosynthesis
MRIAIATDWFAPRRGGIESQLFQLAERLGTRGHEVDVITSTPDAETGRAFRTRLLNVATIPGLQLAVSAALPSRLYRELQRGYDLVHAHVSVVSPLAYGSAIIARALGIPTVVTFHSVLRHKKHLLRAVGAVTGIGASAVVWSAVSELVARQVGDALATTDVVILPNGIDTAFWAGRAAGSSTQGSRPLTLVSTMRLHRKKRPRYLVRAFARAVASVAPGLSVRLAIVGDGPERVAIEREIRDLELVAGPARVELLGWLDADALRSLYAKADAFVLASTRESFGIAALEALAAGLPVIAMAQAGSTEFLIPDQNSLICADDAELVTSIARILTDESLRRRLSSASRSLTRYDWDSVIVDHEAVYARAMKRALSGETAAASA